LVTSPTGKGDPERRKSFILLELMRYTEGLTKVVHEEGDSIDDLFAECEQALAISRNVFEREVMTPPPRRRGRRRR